MGGIKKNVFFEGLFWNYGSLIILSISGLGLNFLIAYFYNAAALGVFNRTCAWYGVLSQITVCGIHMSVTKLTAEYQDSYEEREAVLVSALVIVLIFSIFCVTVIEKILPYIIVRNIDLLVSMQLIMPGLIFFSLNKVLLNYLNGLSKMKAYAFFQTERYLIVMFAVYIMGKFAVTPEKLSLCFLTAESAVFITTICYLLYKKILHFNWKQKYVKEHIRFGIHILPANMVSELNTKVDIICLGYILNNDYLIGIYSFAILFVEGFYQLYLTVRRSINPKITEYYSQENFEKSLGKMNGSLKKYLTICSPLALLLVSIGYCTVCFLLGDKDYITGIKYLLIISTAIALSGKQIILSNLFSQTGFPIYESIINIIVVIINFSLNILLINLLGLLGASVATAVSYLVYGNAIRYFARKKLKLIL